MNALVTALGGDVGQAAARALRQHHVSIVGADTQTLAAAFSPVFCDGWFHVIPPARDPLLPAILRHLVAVREIHVVVFGCEPELQALSDTDLPVPIIRCRPNAMRLFDKVETARVAELYGLPFAPLRDNSVPASGTITKPRQKGSSEQILQEYLHGPEYTVPVWRSAVTGETRTIALRRQLRGGATYRCWYDPEHPETKAAQAVGRLYAEALNLTGSFNIQGCYTDTGFIPFEVNPRISSTASLRDALGFCDLWWSVQEATGQRADSYTPPQRARAVRYWSERVQIAGEWV